MNFKYIKHIIPGAALVLATAGMSSCTGDLDVTPHDPSTQMNTNEPALFTKCYANMALAGPTGPDGDCDMVLTAVQQVLYASSSIPRNFLPMRLSAAGATLVSTSSTSAHGTLLTL